MKAAFVAQSHTHKACLIHWGIDVDRMDTVGRDQDRQHATQFQLLEQEGGKGSDHNETSQPHGFVIESIVVRSSFLLPALLCNEATGGRLEFRYIALLACTLYSGPS